MSTPTEAHLDLALQIAEAFSRSGNVAAAQLIADSEARAVAAAVTALTCTHHNDQQRAECPVCLVVALTAERDHWQKIAVSASQEREHNANVAQAMTAERDLLRACLRDLVDEQNGAPLELRRTHWQAAMDEALAALTKTEGAK